MNEVDKKELRRLAGEASQGKWQHATEQGQIGSVECSGAVMVQVQQMKRGDNAQRNANAAFIAAANPAAILSLLDEIEQCRKDAERWRYYSRRLSPMVGAEQELINSTVDGAIERDAKDHAE